MTPISYDDPAEAARIFRDRARGKEQELAAAEAAKLAGDDVGDRPDELERQVKALRDRADALEGKAK